MRRWLASAGVVAIAIAQPMLAAECAPPSGSVRVMLHDPDVIGARLKTYAKAADSARGRAGAMRQLFEASACPQLTERGDGSDRNVECTVPGASPDTIFVGVGQTYSRNGSRRRSPARRYFAPLTDL